jgi:hypothetical protein
VVRILSFACCRGHHDSGTTELTDKICSRSQFEVQQGGVLLSPINVAIAKIGETTSRYFRISQGDEILACSIGPRTGK